MKKIAALAHLRSAAHMERRWVLPVALGSLLSLLLLFLTASSSSSPFQSFLPFSLIVPSPLPSYSALDSSTFVESKLRPLPILTASSSSSLPPPPRLAYLISGSVGDGAMIKRTLMVLYHPGNQYILHLDLEAPPKERADVRDFVARHPVFSKVRNVRVIAKANLVTYRGPTMVANTLHAAAVLLKEGGYWDWFINLSATDYPLVTQDDLLHTFSYLPRDLNFIDHTSDIGWKEALFEPEKRRLLDNAVKKHPDCFQAVYRFTGSGLKMQTYRC